MNTVVGETSFYGDSVMSVYGVMKDGDGFSREVFALGFLCGEGSRVREEES